MNPNITNTMNQTLFTARVTDEVPPRLSVVFHERSRLNIWGHQSLFLVEDTHQCEISLRDRKPDLIKAVSLDSDHECGTFLSFKEVRQNAYECKFEGTTFEKQNLSHVTLKVRNAKLIVGFRPTPVPTATPANSNSNGWSIWGPPAPVIPNNLWGPWSGLATPPAPANSNPWSIWGPPTTPAVPAATTPAPKTTIRSRWAWDPELNGCLMDGENFKEDCGLSDIEKGIYKTYCKDSSAKDNDLTKETYAKLRTKEQTFEALETMRRQADAHIEHLTEGDTSLYLQVIRLITPNSQNLQRG